MPEIILLPPERSEEARAVIYTVAHQLFHAEQSLEETVAQLRAEWPIHDLDDIRRSYLEQGGVFLAAVENGRIVGTGALRRLEDGVGEIKRLWFLPAYHGQGLGYQLMVNLIAEARRRGYTSVRLCTSPEYQQRAYLFYKKLGFYEIPRYNDDPDDISMELDLTRGE